MENMNPFTAEDLAVIENTLNLIQSLMPVIQKAEACGKDCEAYKRRLDDQRQKLDQIKYNFFKQGKPILMPLRSTRGQSGDLAASSTSSNPSRKKR